MPVGKFILWISIVWNIIGVQGELDLKMRMRTSDFYSNHLIKKNFIHIPILERMGMFQSPKFISCSFLVFKCYFYFVSGDGINTYENMATSISIPIYFDFKSDSGDKSNGPLICSSFCIFGYLASSLVDVKQPRAILHPKP